MFLTSPLIEQAIALKTFQTLTSCPCLHRRPDGRAVVQSCGMGGRRHGQTKNQAELPSPSASSARSGNCKMAVLNSLGSPASRRVYEYAID
jgi:hypothetical protein